jgi:hypothetical protein
MARRSKLLIQPHAPAAPDRYCRLLPEALALTQKKMTPEALEKLAWSMHSNEAPIPVDLQQGHAPPPIAVTYFGQFVDHDLTFDSTPLRDAGSCEPIYTVNNRTPWLDLDHLYGDGPRSSRHAHLYQPDNASFRIGESAPGEEPFDITASRVLQRVLIVVDFIIVCFVFIIFLSFTRLLQSFWGEVWKK